MNSRDLDGYTVEMDNETLHAITHLETQWSLYQDIIKLIKERNIKSIRLGDWSELEAEAARARFEAMTLEPKTEPRPIFRAPEYQGGGRWGVTEL